MSDMSKNNPSRSRREFLAASLGAGGAMLLAAGDGVDPRVAQIMSKAIAIDMHNHVYPAGTEPHPHGQPQRQEEQGHVPDLSLADEIKESGLTAVGAAFVLDFAPNNKPGDARDNFLRWLAAMDAKLKKEHVQRALNVKDLRAAHDQRQPVIVQTGEGAQFIEGRLERVEEVYKRGVRHLQLLHQQDDSGVAVGRRDHVAAHAGGETVLGALKVATQPFIVSHTGLDSRPGSNSKMAAMMNPHLITKERAKVVADAGGVVGVWTKLADSPREFAENLKAMVDAIGIDDVGIGTDTDLLSATVDQGTNQARPGLTGGFFNVVAGEMLSEGFTPDDIGKVGGGNFCRVFGTAAAAHH